MRGRRWEVLLAVALVLGVSAFALYGQTAAEEAPVTSGTKASPDPSWVPGADGRPLRYDRNYKCDLLEALEEPPRLVMLGGSRAQRFEPSYVRELTGLSAFNFAAQNNRPEDAYAISRYLYSRAPDVKLRCFYAVQVTTFSDRTMHPGLLYDERFAQWFPDELVASQKEELGTPKKDGIPSNNHYSPRGCLLYNSYDEKLERGRTQERALKIYIESLLPNAASSGATQTRSQRYFEKFLKLHNEHGVTPAIAIMPYHPVALEAFREVGWQEKNDALLAYLRGLQDEYDIRVLDYTEVDSFGGDPLFFYDGSHIMQENARLLLEQAVRDAPECF